MGLLGTYLLFKFIDKIASEGYDSIEDYCNQTGQNICDVVPDPDEDDYDDDW